MSPDDSQSIRTPADQLWSRVHRLIRDSQLPEAVEIDLVLAELTESAVRLLPGADSAGITVATRSGEVRTASAVGPYPVILDEIQQKFHDGPCLTAAWEHHMVLIDDLATETRWVPYCREAMALTPVRSVMAFELISENHTVGALNFYAERPGVFDDEAVELGLVLAAHAALAWNLVRHQEQFRSALATRDLIGQAKGMIMERFNIGAVQAFDLLKRLSQDSNTPLFDIAQRIVDVQVQSGK